MGIVVLFSLGAGAFAGFQSGTRSQHETATMLARSSVDEQFALAMQDLAEERYDVAYQRLEFVISQNPSYPGATDKMAEVMAVLYATATPTAPPPTNAPTPTRDLRPVEDLFKSGQAFFAEEKWTETIDTLITLRKANSAYQTARVDGMLFLSLRMRGFDKIWKYGDLNGGIYDLALAARFAILDAQANSARELARLYLIGSSFWEVDPAQAVQYFSQVAAAAPGLMDASGWTASARYREVLIQYGDKLASGKDWCAAQQQYELALSIGADAALQEKIQNVALQCSPPSATPTATGEIPLPTAETPLPTATFSPLITPSPTTGNPPIPTNTLPVVEPPTNTPVPPTNTLEAPTNTPEPPIPTDTTAASVAQPSEVSPQ